MTEREDDRCPRCGGYGREMIMGSDPMAGRWIVCRDCSGTGKA